MNSSKKSYKLWITESGDWWQVRLGDEVIGIIELSPDYNEDEYVIDLFHNVDKDEVCRVMIKYLEHNLPNYRKGQTKYNWIYKEKDYWSYN